MLAGLFAWNIVNLIRAGGIYGKADGYSLKANILFGWVIIALILLSGFIIKAVVRYKMKSGYKEDERSWDEFSDEG